MPVKSFLLISFISFLTCPILVAQTLEGKIFSSAETVVPLSVGTMVPSVNVKDKEGNSVSLDSIINDKITVLVFYRGGWCPYCNAQLVDLQSIVDSLNLLKVNLIALGTDASDEISSTVSKDSLGFPIFSDRDLNASKAFGLLYQLTGTNAFLHFVKGDDVPESPINGKNVLPVPAVFLIDKNKTIRYEYFNPDYKIRLDSQTLLQEIKNMLDY